MVCVRLYIYYTKPPDHLWQFHAVVQSAQVLQIFFVQIYKIVAQKAKMC